MTTIAIDITSIAADSRRSCGHELMNDTAEKIKVAHGSIYALTGMYCMFEALIAWHAKGAAAADLPHTDDKESWNFIAIGKDRKIRVWHNGCAYSEEMIAPLAFGSGCEYALALMDAGFSAAEAVAGAAKRDVYTGGPVQVVPIAEAVFRPCAITDAERRRTVGIW